MATIKEISEGTTSERKEELNLEEEETSKEISDRTEEELAEIIQAPINVLAQLKTDNSPLEELWINAKTNVSQKLAIQETVDKIEKTLEEMVPPELLDYKDVFNKVMAERFRNQGLGITQLISRKTLYPMIARSIP